MGRQSRWRTTTRQSAPLRRIGTFGLAVGAACAFSLGIAGQVLTFRTRARLSFAPPPCRMPFGQSQDIPQTDPGGMATPRFWHRLIGFRHVISGSLALASLNHTCRNLVPTFPQRSPPLLLTTAACGGLRSTPDCRPRRTFSSLVQLGTAVWTGDTRDTRPAADLGYLVNKSALRDAESPPECRVEPVQSHSQMRDSNMRRREFIRLIGGSRSRVPTAPESDDFRLREKSMNTGLRLICCG